QVRAELQTAHELGEQLLALAQQTQNPVLLVAAHRLLGTTLFFMGAVAAAHTHFTQGHSSAFLDEDGEWVVNRSRDSWALWCLGYADQGLAQTAEAVPLARQIVHPYRRCLISSMAAVFYQFRREVHLIQARTEAALSLA